MPPSSSVRTTLPTTGHADGLLLTSSGVASATLAGSSGLLGGSSAKANPDARPSQYEVYVENRLEDSEYLKLAPKRGFMPSAV